MKFGVIQFPGSNCDRDLHIAFEAVGGAGYTQLIWHKDATLPAGLDVIGIPGGFSFGDYLRCGAIAAHSPVMRAVSDFAQRGGYVLGICNGFQILTEANLLPGVLMQNAGLRFLSKTVTLRVETTNSSYTSAYENGALIEVPIAHHEGNYTAAADTLKRLSGEDRIAFKYAKTPNGAQHDIAGILSENRRVLGMMPHPERAADPNLGGTDGAGLFKSLAQQLVAA